MKGALLWLSVTSLWCITSYMKRNSLEIVCRSSKSVRRKIQEQGGDDGCNSLFYGPDPAAEGRGYVVNRLVDQNTVNAMTTVHKEYILLSKQLYGDVVSMLPTVCVDVICQRQKDKRLLLFYRKDKPAAGVWWWPGGRMFKGETFFATAARKLRDETGNSQVNIVSQEILAVWNTFFPDSSWDADRLPGREGCQTVNIVVFCKLGDNDCNELEVDSEAASAWAVDGHRWVTVEEALKPDSFDKYVQCNVQLLVTRGALQ